MSRRGAAELRVGLRPLGPEPLYRQFGVSRVEASDQIAGLDPRALVDGKLEDPPANLRGHLYLGCFDVSRHSHAIGRAAAWQAASASGITTADRRIRRARPARGWGRV